MADLDKQGHSIEHVQEMVAVHHHSQRPHASSATYHVYTQQHHFIPKNQLHQLRSQNSSTKDSNSSLTGSLTKRPTFEALDKRKSWTLEQQQAAAAAAAAGALIASSATLASNGNEHALGRPGSQQSRISAYQNSSATHILTKDQLNYDPRRKKPVPLPRSKIPVLLPGGVERRNNPGAGRFSGLGPRSKVRFLPTFFIRVYVTCLSFMAATTDKTD